MNTKHEVYLAKVQSTFGTAETGLVGSDLTEVQLDGSKLDIIPSSDEDITVQGTFGQNAAVIGASYCDVQLDYAMRSFGVATTPDWVTMLQAAGFALSTADFAGDDQYVLVPTDTTKDATVWKYMGALGASASAIKKAENVVFDWKISGEVNKKCMLSLIGKGALTEIPAAGTVPTVTPSGAYTPAILPLTKTIIGSTVYSPIKFEISGNNVVEQRVSGSNYGYGQTEITDMLIKGTVTVYAEKPGTLDPYTSMQNSTTGLISFEFGKTDNKILIAGTTAQITDVKESKTGNLVMWDISFLLVNNGFTIKVNSDLT